MEDMELRVKSCESLVRTEPEQKKKNSAGLQQASGEAAIADVAVPTTSAGLGKERQKEVEVSGRGPSAL